MYPADIVLLWCDYAKVNRWAGNTHWCFLFCVFQFASAIQNRKGQINHAILRGSISFLLFSMWPETKKINTPPVSVETKRCVNDARSAENQQGTGTCGRIIQHLKEYFRCRVWTVPSLFVRVRLRSNWPQPALEALRDSATRREASELFQGDHFSFRLSCVALSFEFLSYNTCMTLSTWSQ